MSRSFRPSTPADGLLPCVMCGKSPMVSDVVHPDGYGNYWHIVTCACMEESGFTSATPDSPDAPFDDDWNTAQREARVRLAQQFYDEVCRLAERTIEQHHKLEGVHYAAMQTVLVRWKGGEA